MYDVFSEGEGIESPSAETEVETPVTDSNEGVAAEPTVEIQGEVEQEAPAAEVPVEVPAETPPTPEELAAMEEEAVKAADDPKTAKWYKNYVKNVFNPKLASLTEQLGTYEPLTNFGTVEEINEKLNLLNGLETVRSNPETGMPERTTEPFVKALYEKDADAAYQLMSDLARLPSPTNQGMTVLQELFHASGIDPTRLEEIKTFAANGYQLQQGQFPPPTAEELETIPDHLKATFASLSPERREALLFAEDHVRDASLEDTRAALEAKRTQELAQKTEAEQKQAAEQKQQAEFKQAVEEKGQEHFTKASEAVFTSFVDSLAKQANMSRMDAVMITNTVLNSFEPTLAGRQSLEALKAEGVQIDPVIPQTITALEENARHIAYYEQTRDTANMQKAVARQVELQEKLIAKGNKIVATLAQKRAESVTKPIKEQNSLLAATQTNRYAASAGVGSTVNSNNGVPDFNFDDDSYLEDLRATGFGSQRR